MRACAPARSRAHPRLRAQIRRAYRNLITKEHPDKGGDAERFGAIQRAYDVLSSEAKRKQYDATGKADRTVDEELLEAFGDGARERARKGAVLAAARATGEGVGKG